MATYYAWSNFPVERNEYGQTTKTIQAGDKITQADLKVSDEDWEELINLGAVREDEYPKDLGSMESPAEYAAAHPEEEQAEATPAPAPTASPTPPQAPK